MKSTIIALMFSATLCAIHAQSSSAPTAENRGQTRAGSTARISRADGADELARAREKLAMLRLKYTEQHPEVVDIKKRIAELEQEPSANEISSSFGGGSVARYGQRLQTIVRRGDSVAPGSIILTTEKPQKEVDELSEDLAVLNYIFMRNFERVFGEKGPEYRLGVPITMSGGQLVETSYLQDFGVLVKVHVPFPVVSSGDNDKKSEPIEKENSEWEKARRALFGADNDGTTPSVERTAPYDEKIVDELKTQMFDALKSAANIRHLDAKQSITVVVMGGPNFALKLVGGGRVGSANATRPTMMTIRITKAQADAAAKDSFTNDLSKQATVAAYFDSANAANSAPRGVTTYGGYGASSYGGAGMGGGYYPPSTGVVGR